MLLILVCLKNTSWSKSGFIQHFFPTSSSLSPSPGVCFSSAAASCFLLRCLCCHCFSLRCLRCHCLPSRCLCCHFLSCCCSCLCCCYSCLCCRCLPPPFVSPRVYFSFVAASCILSLSWRTIDIFPLLSSFRLHKTPQALCQEVAVEITFHLSLLLVQHSSHVWGHMLPRTNLIPSYFFRKWL